MMTNGKLQTYTRRIMKPDSINGTVDGLTTSKRDGGKSMLKLAASRNMVVLMCIN